MDVALLLSTEVEPQWLFSLPETAEQSLEFISVKYMCLLLNKHFI